ncbi:MAG TPA: peptidoglycan editing factor PgeF [Pseudogracilibacillus sp.]|nr:peptidoglycan editing factor PgeF [Pseudogracilibacillus sp.]
MSFQTIINNELVIAGVSLKDDAYQEKNNMGLHVSNNEAAVIDNRKQLAEAIGVTLNDFVCANQTHSDRFYQVMEEDKGRGAWSIDDAIEDVDALYTKEADLVLTSFTADCVPLVFYDESTNIIGAIHSGWKGSIQSITEKLFTHLMKEHSLNSDSCHVYIGTCLSQRNFEVDEDVMLLFKQLQYADQWIRYDASRKKYFIDNQQVVKAQCMRSGIKEEHIHIDSTCTMDSETGFSYREDKQAGRHMTFIMRKS